MNLFTKRLGLVLAGVVGVGAIASLAIGASFALFTASGPAQSQTFAAGTVFFGTGSGPGANLVTAHLGGLAPGDIYCGMGGKNGDATFNPVSTPAENLAAGYTGLDCNSAAGVAGMAAPATFSEGGYYQVNYSGSLKAFIGLNVTATSTSACNADGTAPASTTLSNEGYSSAAIANIDAMCATNAGLPFAQRIGTEPIWEGDNSNCLSNNPCGGPPATLMMASDAYGPDANNFTTVAPPAHTLATCTDYASGAQQNSCTWSNTGSPFLFDYVTQGSYTSPWSAGDSEPLYLIVAIPSNVIPPTSPNNPAPFTNQMQGSAISLTLSATAVQSANNTNANGGPISWS